MLSSDTHVLAVAFDCLAVFRDVDAVPADSLDDYHGRCSQTFGAVLQDFAGGEEEHVESHPFPRV